MEDNHLRDLLDSFMYAVSRTPRHTPIGTADARKDIPKIHLKCRSIEEISHIMDFSKLYIDDDLLSNIPAIPPPTNQLWQSGCDFGYGDSETVYVRLNEKHEPDGIYAVLGNEDGGMDMLNEREIRVQLEDKIEDMANILKKSKDVELRIVRDSVTVAEINRKIVSKREN